MSLVLALSLFAALGLLARTLLAQAQDSGPVRAPCAALLAFAAVTVVVSDVLLYVDIAPAYRLRNELVARDARLREARTRVEREVRVAPIASPIPDSVYFVEYQRDAKEWLNWCAARHYGLDGIRLVDSPLR